MKLKTEEILALDYQPLATFDPAYANARQLAYRFVQLSSLMTSSKVALPSSRLRRTFFVLRSMVTRVALDLTARERNANIANLKLR